jgi:hypothetical protein
MNVAERCPIFLQMATFTKAWEHHALGDEALKAGDTARKGSNT